MNKKIYSLLLVVCLVVSLAIPAYASGWYMMAGSYVSVEGDYVHGHAGTATNGHILDYVFMSTYLYEDNLIVRTAFNQDFYTTYCSTNLAPVLYKADKTYKIHTTHTINDGGIFKTFSTSDTLYIEK